MEQFERIPLDLEKIKTQEEDDLFYFVDQSNVSSERITAPRYSYWRSVFRIFFSKKLNIIFLSILVLVVAMAFIFPAIFPYDKFAHNTEGIANLSPAELINRFGFSFEWILGTGQFGDSIFYGIWASARISLSLSLICALINMSIGILIGAVWGYNKAVDSVLNVVYNIIANVPYILMISVLVYVIGSGFGSFVFALTITGWLGIAYFMRTQVLIIRDREYNLASKTLGTPMARIVTKNVLPYLTSVIVTLLASEIPHYISMEVFLTYIGVGLSAEVPSLGHMISDAQTSWMSYPWAFWSPVAISAIITVILYVVGQNLADASDPRSHMK
ncbi:MAG: ABC transporter permease [Bacilli bacterium]|nr:ABC transporter permease [Bacilli bacterium]